MANWHARHGQTFRLRAVVARYVACLNVEIRKSTWIRRGVLFRWARCLGRLFFYRCMCSVFCSYVWLSVSRCLVHINESDNYPPLCESFTMTTGSTATRTTVHGLRGPNRRPWPAKETSVKKTRLKPLKLEPKMAADGGACIICLDTSPPPIQSGCACRGDSGLAHIACLVQAAASQQAQRGNGVW